VTDQVFVETSVLLLAFGGDHPERDVCRALLARAASGGLRLHVSVEAIQEFCFHRMRRAESPLALGQTRRLMTACHLHPFSPEVLIESLRLIEVGDVQGRDAVHAATVIVGGFDRIVSLDADFDSVPGLVRVTPAEVLA
jgi:uncharacterized protein